jgi:nucleoid-associated protein YgaU
MTISRSDVLSVLVLLCTAAVPAAVFGQTPTNPSADTVTVRKGDTLWGLARTYYGDPLLWPQIYRLNTLVVEDPHWIYPGEVLTLRGGEQTAAVPDTSAKAPAAEPQPEAAAAAAAAAVPAAGDSMAANPEPAAEVADAADTTIEAADEYLDQPMGDDTTGALFPSATAHSLTPYTADVANQYRPLRRSEFYSSGYLTEGQELPFGKLKGPVTPKDVDITPNGHGAAMIHNEVGVTPPKGATYQVGDTLLIVYVGREVAKYGNVIFPTGMAVVRDVSRSENVAEVIAQYNQLYRGMNLLPAEKFPGSGTTRAVPISDGVEGKVITRVFQTRLNLIQDVLLLDKGRADGVALGDLFEIRRRVEVLPGAADVTPELICRVQVVHVREHTASGKIVWLGAGSVPDGSPARQVAKLPS